MNDIISKEELTGGKRVTRRPSATPVKQRKPSATVPKKKKGGAVIDDLKNLAVPFAILLAKQGLQGLFDNKVDENVAVSTSPKKTVRTPKTTSANKNNEQREQQQSNKHSSSSSKKNQQQLEGGACASCQGATASMVGGSKSERALNKSYATLSKRIDEFLSKY